MPSRESRTVTAHAFSSAGLAARANSSVYPVRRRDGVFVHGAGDLPGGEHTVEDVADRAARVRVLGQARPRDHELEGDEDRHRGHDRRAATHRDRDAHRGERREPEEEARVEVERADDPDREHRGGDAERGELHGARVAGPPERRDRRSRAAGAPRARCRRAARRRDRSGSRRGSGGRACPRCRACGARSRRTRRDPGATPARPGSTPAAPAGSRSRSRRGCRRSRPCRGAWPRRSRRGAP